MTERDIQRPQKYINKTNKIFLGMMCTLIKDLFLILRGYLDMIIDLVFSFIWEGSRQAIPDLEKKHSMLADSAVSLAAKIRNKQLKSETLVQACIERIQTVNPILNAVTDERFEDALTEAREIDAMIEKGQPDEYFKEKPFLGVPFTAKESHAVAGMLHTLGISVRERMRATEDAECVRLLRAAGAIPIAVTNVPELNKWQETRNLVFGQTNNPYHTGRTVGGSSGGEAALMAALASPISLCSDIGGSTRMPAFFCGLFGLNPTAGYTSLKGSTLRSGDHATIASIGFISKHAEDLAPLTAVVAGDKAPQLQLDRNVNMREINFFYVESTRDIRVSPISKDLRKAMRKAIAKLSEYAASTDKTPTPLYCTGFDHMASLWRYWMTHEADSFPKLLTNNQGEAKALIELPKKLLGLSPYTLAAIMKLVDEQLLPQVNSAWAESVTKELMEDLMMVLNDSGVLLFPSAPHVAPYHYSLYLRPYNFAYWGVFNAIRFPSVQVPLGLNEEGIPIGIQVVAAPKQEALCLTVARYLEKELGGYVPPCKIVQ